MAQQTERELLREQTERCTHLRMAVRQGRDRHAYCDGWAHPGRAPYVSITVRSGPSALAGLRLTPEEARTLARHLTVAAQWVESMTQPESHRR